MDGIIGRRRVGGGLAIVSFVARVVYAADTLRDLTSKGKHATS